MKTNYVFCTGLVKKPINIEEHFDEYENHVTNVTGLTDFSVQVNIDWRPLQTSPSNLVYRAVERFGDRIKSIVTYWDPAHSAEEMTRFLSEISNAFEKSIYVRFLMKSAESVRMYSLLLPTMERASRHGILPLLSVDHLSGPDLSHALRLVSQKGVASKLQITHQTHSEIAQFLSAETVGMAQFAIGTAEYIQDGIVALNEGMVVSGRYDLSRFKERVLSISPKLPPPFFSH